MSEVKLQYHCIRNVSSPEDAKAGRKRWCGVAPANEFFGVPDDDNVREFLELEVKKSTRVNDAMRDTLETDREVFGILNGGISITCTKATVDDNKKTVSLDEPSIINGSQTRGVLKKFFEEHAEDTNYPSINFELIEDDNTALHARISIARNFQNQVAPVSVYGSKGLFDELEKAMQCYDSTIRLRKSETDAGDKFIDTEKLIQVITVSVPKEIEMPRPPVAGSQARPYAFSQKAVCLKDFDDIMTKKKDGDFVYVAARKYFLDVAHDVWALYLSLDTRSEFKVFRQKINGDSKFKSPVKKTDDMEGIREVAQGIKFPIMSALALFAEEVNDKWCLKLPAKFDFADLVNQARITYYPGPGANDPAKMGKSQDCYLSLYPVVSGFLKYSK